MPKPPRPLPLPTPSTARRLLRWALAPSAEERSTWGQELVRDARARAEALSTEHGRSLEKLERLVLVTMAVSTLVASSGLGLYAGKIKPEMDAKLAERERVLDEAKERLERARKALEEAKRRKAEEEGEMPGR